MSKLNLIAGVLLVASAFTAQAAVIVDRANVPGAQTVIDFESFDGYVVDGGSLSLGGVTLSSSNQFTVGQYIADLAENGAWGTGNHFVSFDNLGSMTLNLSFAQPTQGVAFDYSIWETDPEGSAMLTARYFDSADNLIKSTKFIFSAFGSTSYNAFQSFGFVSEGAGISRMTLSGDGVVFDNLTFTAAVPEPGQYAMLLAGLGLMGGIARRRSRG
ncbi:PEP-CTERM sorting domain-containing protein [Dechloromonas agitata]|uniref:PEP-CTERM sorting domain-containing protein n=1 Tax=Dechloromonas agitata TaxID=73030 RepID=UPI00237E4BEA|nr:PEP-CTERM sorting domain-containing protein [Dechloromonas agitata]MDE1547356.1 PEP-CTERM sorting domain-containing protein [Dechloromonas agitata]